MRQESEATQARPDGRRFIAMAVGLAALLAFALWLRRPSEPPPSFPAEPVAASAGQDAQVERLTPLHAKAPPEPAARSWPRLAAALELLEKNDHGKAAAHFEQLIASGNLAGEEAGMALYFQAEALFAMDRLQEARVLYRKFLDAHPSLPAADNARSALDYIARAAEYRKALATGGRP
ncbi:MAG: hypothetical protein HY816_16165 [Candidatus Wallbacteria bacterium]|nr:hypothetical protein [Candidatus Wallbacteria bacterium]